MCDSFIIAQWHKSSFHQSNLSSRCLFIYTFQSQSPNPPFSLPDLLFFFPSLSLTNLTLLFFQSFGFLFPVCLPFSSPCYGQQLAIWLCRWWCCLPCRKKSSLSSAVQIIKKTDWYSSLVPVSYLASWIMGNYSSWYFNIIVQKKSESRAAYYTHTEQIKSNCTVIYFQFPANRPQCLQYALSPSLMSLLLWYYCRKWTSTIYLRGLIEFTVWLLLCKVSVPSVWLI